jgi:hypothetical protein
MSKPEDWLPPFHPPADDLQDIQTSWGKIPRWKARALALAEIQSVVNDAAEAAAPDAKKPPPLKADTVIADAIASRKRHQYYADLYSRCDALERRLDILASKDKAKRAAHAALMAAEAAFTAEPSEDDVEGMTMN